MRAVVMRKFGDEEVLEVEEVDAPRPGPYEVAVKVAAVEVSRTRDIGTRSGRHPYSHQVTLPRILGGEFAGVVEEIGTDVEISLLGARVAASAAQSCGRCHRCQNDSPDLCSRVSMLGIHRDGSYAEVAVVQASALSRIPDSVPMAEAAAMAAVGPVAFAQLDLAGIGAATPPLVTGATGALGTTLIALANHFGARPIGLSRRPGEIPPGLDLTSRLDSQSSDLTQRLLDASGDTGIEAVIDNVADADAFERYFAALAVGARIVFSGAIGNPEPPVLAVPARTLYAKSISLLGLRTKRSGDAAAFWNLVERGFRLPSGLVREMPLDRVREAHALISAGRQLGHTVLTV